MFGVIIIYTQNRISVLLLFTAAVRPELGFRANPVSDTGNAIKLSALLSWFATKAIFRGDGKRLPGNE